MRRFGLRQLKWVTGAVAVLGVTSLHAAAWLANPGSSPLPAAIRAAVLAAAVLAFNQYAFALVARRDRELDRERERLVALHRISGGLALVPGVERNLAGALDILRRAVGADVAAWLEPAAAGTGAVCRALSRRLEGGGAAARAPHAGRRGRGGDAGAADRVALPVPAEAMWRQLASGGTVIVEDTGCAGPVELTALALWGADRLAAVAAAGAGVQGRTLGAVLVGWRQPRTLAAHDREFVQNVAHLLGVAAENLRLYKETQRLGALEERARIAREMHDGLAQALTYLKLRAEAALAQAHTGGAPALEAALRSIRQGALQALGDVRQTLHQLKDPAAAGGADLALCLQRVVQDWSQLNGIDAEVELPGVPVELPGESAAHVARIVQEALANVRKHAQASHVRVRLACSGGAVTVAVADDGRGFDVDAVAGRAGHYGLGHLQERAASLGGTLTVASSPGCGTEVVLHLPPARVEAAVG